MMKKEIGIYFYRNGDEGANKINYEEVISYAEKLSNVAIVWREKDLSLSDVNSIARKIREKNLKRIVIAGIKPGFLKSLFSRAMVIAGSKGESVTLASFYEHGAYEKVDTDRAKAIVACAVYNIPFLDATRPEETSVNENTLVIGGGIAGIQASLEIANGGYKVYLVEKSSTLGGHMAMFDKTFPTLDCAACILTPKMVEVGQHENIEVLTCSEVEEISGEPGNYKVKIRKKARYITEKCTGCGECTMVCPIEKPSEFDQGLVMRKLTYRAFPQAVPNSFLIDKKGHPPCRVTCPAHVYAEGYVSLIAMGKFKEAIELVRKTMPFIHVCGRTCTHPCETECERGKIDKPVSIRALKRFLGDYEAKHGREKAKPLPITKEEKVAIIGSGPAGLTCAYDLIRMGYAVTVFEAEPKPGGLLRYGIPNYRLPENILDNEISYIEELGVEIKTNTLVKDLKEIFNQGYKAIFLACGAGVSQKMGIPGEETPGVLHALPFLNQINKGEKVKLGEKVAVIGGGNAAVDAARVAWRLGCKEVTLIYRRSRAEMPAIPAEVEEMEKEGVKIHFLAAPVKVISSNGKLTGIECIKMELGPPDESGRRRPVPVKGSEFVVNVDNVIIAIGQQVDTEKISKEIALTKWGTVVVDPITLETNIKGVFAGGDVVSGPSVVIEAIAAGKQAAISIDRYLRGVDLKEGRPKKLEKVKDISKEGVIPKERAVMPMLDVSKRIGNFEEVELGYDEKTAVEEASRCLHCTVCLECLQCENVCEAKVIDHDMRDEIIEVEVGNIIVATGFKLFNAKQVEQYGYGKYPNVFTSLEFERLLNASGPTNGNIYLRTKDKDGKFVFTSEYPKSLAIIHCVGSRDENYNKYCSRVCCMYSLKFAHLAKEKLHNADVYEFYIDMRAFGKGYEEFYERIKNEGIFVIRGKTAKIIDVDGKLLLRGQNVLNNKRLEQTFDMVVLSVGLNPTDDAEKLSKMLGIYQTEEGWFRETNFKGDPMGTYMGGVFIAGVCQGPKDIPDTVAQGASAASRVLQSILKGKINKGIKDVPYEKIVLNAKEFLKI